MVKFCTACENTENSPRVSEKAEMRSRSLRWPLMLLCGVLLPHFTSTAGEEVRFTDTTKALGIQFTQENSATSN